MSRRNLHRCYVQWLCVLSQFQATSGRHCCKGKGHHTQQCIVIDQLVLAFVKNKQQLFFSWFMWLFQKNSLTCTPKQLWHSHITCEFSRLLPRRSLCQAYLRCITKPSVNPCSICLYRVYNKVTSYLIIETSDVRTPV